MSVELIEFLRARFDEDAQVASAATWCPGASRWSAHHREEYDGRWVIVDSLDDRVIEVDTEASDDACVAAHIARHDPARVLRDLEAKRRIVAEYERYAAERRRAMGGWDPQSEVSPILAALAAVYAEHEDYRENWRPTDLA
jgi:hypothetical protein